MCKINSRDGLNQANPYGDVDFEKEFQKDIDDLILLTKKTMMRHGIDDALRMNLKYLEDLKKEGLKGV